MQGEFVETCRFSNPFVQRRLYNALTLDLIGDRTPILTIEPLDTLADVFDKPEIDLPALLERYKKEPPLFVRKQSITVFNTEPLYRLLRALAGICIFSETEDRFFENTPSSLCLGGKLLKSAALLFHSNWHDSMWDNLLYSLRTGKPAFEKACGTTAFYWFEKNPEEAEIFHRANSYKAAFSHGVIAEAYDFAGIGTLVDVGGGTGSLMVEILKGNAQVKGIVAEFPKQSDMRKKQ